MSMIAVLDDYQSRAKEFANWESLGVPVRFLSMHLEGKELIDALGDCDIVVAMRERTAIPKRLLDELPSIRLIVTTGMANAAIDVAAAHDRSIVVCGTPSAAAGTLEQAWALILAGMKHLALEDRELRAGRWQTTLASDLYGKRLGLIGLGRLGAGMVPVAKAFSMEVVAWSQNLTKARTEEVGVKFVSKEELISTSDVISIHLRLSERTTALIGAAEIATMKPGALLLNTSRGPIIEEQAMIDALQQGRIRAALDVYDVEPLPLGHPLTRLDNAVLAPHLGYSSEDNIRAMYESVVEDIAAFLAGNPIRVI